MNKPTAIVRRFIHLEQNRFPQNNNSLNDSRLPSRFFCDPAFRMASLSRKKSSRIKPDYIRNAGFRQFSIDVPGEVSLIGNEYSELVKFSVPPSDDHADQRHTKRASRDAVDRDHSSQPGGNPITNASRNTSGSPG